MTITLNGTTGITSTGITETSDGNVGIGTSSPTNKLHAFSLSTTATVAKFGANNYGNAGTTYVEIGTQYGDGGSRIGNINPTGNQGTLVLETMTGTSGVFAERARIDADGLKFNGDTAAANALDDYEEGEWTVVNRSIVPLTITNNNTARYIKIGRLVFINMYITYPTTSDTNQAKINLPFTCVGYSYIVGRFQGSTSGFVLQTADGADEAAFHSATNSVGLMNQNLSGYYVIISGCFIANT